MPGLTLNLQNRKDSRYILYWGKSIYNRYNNLRTAEFMLRAIERDYGPFPVGHVRIFDTHSQEVVNVTS